MDNHDKIHLYSKDEEKLNTVTHGAAAVIALIMLIFMAIKISGDTTIVKVSMLTFSIATLLVYAFSTMYHGAKKIENKIFLQKIDHSMVSIIVFGTAVPALLILSKGIVPYIMLVLTSAATVCNIVLNMLSVNKYKRYSQLLYLLAVIFIVIGMAVGADGLSRGFWALFVSGFGVIIIGSVFYVRKDKKYTHVVWHVADITTSVLHFLAFYFFIL